MIGVSLQNGLKTMQIVVNGNEVLFGESRGAGMVHMAKIEGLKLDYQGIIKEFPDLAILPYEEARLEASKRFRNKICSFKTEEERIKYIIKDLKNYGWEAKQIIRPGFREQKVKKWEEQGNS